MTDGYTIIKETELSLFPECICIYYYNYKYMMVEINTGSSIRSIKPISESFKTITELMNNFDENKAIYKMLNNYIIKG